ncbi:sel1 repeat family protein [Bacteroides sp. 214]|uniref:tetratricopeptide repeat protein n=1 Tax=Bacteroides sp. 214 TaxID=2302935 RepID=UPI0013D1D305|nr:SEL1-like repeat protein [Bacteroides sp. 214]NDW13140.1 sel1 repeat family protein [Bacteroides sp. 214]
MRKVILAVLMALVLIPVSHLQAQSTAEKELLSMLKKAEKEVASNRYDKAKSLLKEINQTFKNEKRTKGIDYLLFMYYAQKLSYQMKDTKGARSYYNEISYSQSLDKKIDPLKSVIAAQNDMLRESFSNEGPHYAAFYMMEAQLFLQNALQAGIPSGTTPFLKELLALCGFDFSKPNIEAAIQTTKARLLQFNNAELCDVVRVGGSDVAIFHVLDIAAKNGSAEANVLAGYYVENGKGVHQSYTEALGYYRVAADAGNVRGICSLASLYFWGKGTEPDRVKAAGLLAPIEQKEEFGKWGGAYLMGYLYETGTGVVKNRDTAIAYYMIATENDDVKKRKEDAFIQYQRLADERESDAITERIKDKDVTKLSADELRELALDYEYYNHIELAKKFFKMAADKNDAYSCNSIGILYSVDKKDEEEKKQAAEYFKKGAELGYGPAMHNCARVLFLAEGTMPDIDKAKELAKKYFNLVKEEKHYSFMKSELLRLNPTHFYKDEDIIKGVPLAELYKEIDTSIYLCNLGFTNRKSNTAGALYYYERTRARGNKKAAAGIGLIYWQGSETLKPDYKKAFDYFTESLPNEWGYYGLGELYERGLGVEANPQKALEYYKKAQEKGMDGLGKKIKALNSTNTK